MPLSFEPIGIIRTPHTAPAGTPIQPRFAAGVEGTVEVYDSFAEGLADLDGFDRIWLVYWFDRVGQPQLRVTPFMDDQPRGLFATRAPCRPNPIGISCVRLLEVSGSKLRVADVDMLDHTPLLDIKPYAPRFDHYDVVRSGWLDHASPGRTRANGRFDEMPDIEA